LNKGLKPDWFSEREFFGYTTGMVPSTEEDLDVSRIVSLLRGFSNSFTILTSSSKSSTLQTIKFLMGWLGKWHLY
jgi:hypothetical protein